MHLRIFNTVEGARNCWENPCSGEVSLEKKIKVKDACCCEASQKEGEEGIEKDLGAAQIRDVILLCGSGSILGVPP